MDYANTLHRYYADNLILDMMSSNGLLLKQAQVGDMLSSAASSIKNYVLNRINPNDKVGSVIDILAPGAITVLLRSLGFGGITAGLFGMAMSAFNIDVGGILKSIWEKIKSLLSSNPKISPQQIDQAVQTSVAENTGEFTEDDAAKAQQVLSQSQDQQKAIAKSIRDARMVKLAIIEYEQLTKNAWGRRRWEPGILESIFGHRQRTGNILTTILSWVLKIIIVSAGLDVGGQLIRKFLGMSSAFDGPNPAGGPSGLSSGQSSGQTAAPVSTQTKFKVQPSYKSVTRNAPGTFWAESIRNDRPSIEEMLISFAKEVYQGLDGLESVIRSAPGFQVVAERIVNSNQASAGGNVVILPYYFHNKKEIVDLFIDDVAEKTPDTTEKTSR